MVALPLVLVDMWASSGGATCTVGTRMGLLLLVLGIILTWLFYILVARLALWRLSRRASDGVESW